MFNRIVQKVGPIVFDLACKLLMYGTKQRRGRVPFGSEELRLLVTALRSQNLFSINGTMIPAFEREFASVYRVPYAVASTSGTAAIHTALGALNLNPGLKSPGKGQSCYFR